ncbi:spore germination protein [Paenibacillus sp.]|uniref:spore germination protein n=1 Tax=Paenibacillus sp. TaxID=58172 RepID=UPI002810B742|nr:spore germination protein [Paenibacillus sp.]
MSGGANSKRNVTICTQLNGNIQTIRELTGNSSDVVIRTFAACNGTPAAIAFISGLTDNAIVNENILRPLMTSDPPPGGDSPPSSPSDFMQTVVGRILTVNSVKSINTIADVLTMLFEGNTIVFLEGVDRALAVNTPKWEHRGVEEPSSQTVIRGPKEGFNENIGTNLALLRRRIKSPNLWKIDRRIGKQTQTDVCVLYLKGTADEDLVTEVLRRLDKIETDSILESGFLEEFIQDQTFTPFPTVINSERPDATTAAILEGKIAILTDGTPFALILPVTFFEFLLASEDYYQRFDISSFLRVLRFGAFTASMLLPSIYIAITTFHQEMLPTTMLISLAAQREGVPFPAFVEAFLMEITFEVLREAGTRMPRAIGPAISIVGALVLGQAAVEAGLVSAAMVIVVSFTAISSFVAPATNIAIASRLLRFVLMIFSATLGFFGIMTFLFMLLIHMAGIRSFGVPYLSPFAPILRNNWKDVFVRVPWRMMTTRPLPFASNNKRRQRQKPDPS